MAESQAERAVILAGGKGSRLGPYTTVLPKPLLPIGDRAILDVVVQQLHIAGCRHITLAVGHLAHLVRAVMGDGTRYGLTIDYHEEDQPLGTVGPLSTIRDLREPFLLMNGDVLTSLDYGRLMESHREAGNMLTIAAHQRVVRTEYGVLHVHDEPGDTQRLLGFEEKPELPFLVSMGVYAVDPRVLQFIDRGERLDLPELVGRLLDAGEAVGSFAFDGFWLDIGRHEDYERAIREFQEVEPLLLRERDADAVGPFVEQRSL
jgi:NDP-sugar pyrophosphorylase family protein